MLIPQNVVYLFLHIRLSTPSNSILSYILALYFSISLPCMCGQRLDYYTTRLMEMSEMLPYNHGGIIAFYPFFSQREINGSIMQMSCLTFSPYVSSAELSIGLSQNLIKNLEESFISNVAVCWDNQA
jgi:hypothetical protein